MPGAAGVSWFCESPSVDGVRIRLAALFVESLQCRDCTDFQNPWDPIGLEPSGLPLLADVEIDQREEELVE